MPGFKSKVAMKNDEYTSSNLVLSVGEGRVYGSRYHTVHPGPFWEMSTDLWNSMMEWNVDTFGPSPCDGVWTPNARWYANNAKFWFRNEKDLTMFILRWS